MYARVTSSELAPDDVETFTSMIRDQVIPRARDLKGFKGGYWLADRNTGQVLAVTLFESEEALKASDAQAARIREESSHAAGLPAPSFREFEVVALVEMTDLLAA